MRKILNFDEFNLNEASSPLMKIVGAVLSGKGGDLKNIDRSLGRILFPDEYNDYNLGMDNGTDDEASEPGEDRVGKRDDETTTSTQVTPVTPVKIETDYTITPGNDDFSLYMQHQQGPAGAAGIVKALNGTGKMNPDTVKTKNGVKYANLVGNIPSDTPQVKRDLIKALDAGDQRTAAALFLNSWKEKWNRKSQVAKKVINEPKYAEVKKAIKQATDKYGVPFDFAIAVAFTESGFNPKAGNRRYKGLFAMDPNQSYGGIVTPMGSKWADPYVNAENGVRLLRRQIVDFKKELGKDLASLNLSPWAKNLA